jgi:hypothetical protein
MSGLDEEALPAGWDVLCRADALALAPTEGAKQRVRLRLAATLGVAAGLGAAGGLAAGAASGASEGLLGGLAKALLLKKVVVLGVVAATALTGGTVAYVQVQAQQQQTAQKAMEHAASARAVPVLPAPVAHAEDVAPPAPPETLGAERALLDDARSAIAQGRLKEAQGLLERHAQAFPVGQLSEEREALRIRLLVKQGRAAEAFWLGARFRKEHPHSIQQPGIDEALRSGRR